jgi:O-antigen/teichoic acid export membrane protein
LKNVGYALSKLVLLATLAVALPAYGVLASWTLPLAFAIVPTTVVIFRWLLPRRSGALDPPASYVSPPHLARFLAGDYLGTLAWLACTTLLPIVVVQECGPRQTAYFFLAWQIATALHNVAPDIGAALVAEAAADEEKLSAYSYRATLHVCRLVVPLALVVAVGAQPILSLFGADYADQGADLLRLLALSAIPNVITAAFVSVARVERRVRAMLAVLSAFAATVLVLAYVLLPAYGITGVGIAWLIAQVLFASGVFIWQLRPRWRIRSVVGEVSA